MRSLVGVLCLCAALAAVAPSTAAAADNPFPLGKNSVPKIYWGDQQPPVGLSFGYLKLTDTVAISDFAVTVGGQALPPGLVVVDRATIDTSTYQGRFDAWVLPFVNVYAFAATLHGSVHDVPLTLSPQLGVPAAQVPVVEFDFNGHLYSLGAVFAAGYKKFYASYDVNRAWMTMDIAPKTKASVVQRIRVGARTNYKGNLMKFYAGASLRDASTSGSGSVPGVPGASFSLKAKSADSWNTQVGADIGVSKQLFVNIEVGLGTRKQFTMMSSVRF